MTTQGISENMEEQMAKKGHVQFQAETEDYNDDDGPEDAGMRDSIGKLKGKKFDKFDPTASVGVASTVAPEDSQGLTTWSTMDMRSTWNSSFGDETVTASEFLGNDDTRLETVDESPAVRSALSKEALDFQDILDGKEEVPPSLDSQELTKQAASEVMPSIGSKEHASGECRPCAWFWKPGSCQNGSECRHCHLCPDGEIKNRKKNKIEKKKQEAGSEQQTTVIDGQEQEAEGKAAELTPPPGLPGLATPAAEKGKPQEPMESAGAAKHGTGECKPCAWFWKPGSCEHGKDCMHCHLCPEGELKARKRMKARQTPQKEDVSTLNLDAPAFVPHPPPGLTAPKEEEESKSNAWYLSGGSLIGQGADGRLKDKAFAKDDEREEAQLEADTAGDVYSSEESDEDNDSKQLFPASPIAAGVKADSDESEEDLPSNGSKLHAIGKCRPCAWFWKPGSCQNGKECCHCHLCPSTELKYRRRAKEAAMRVGALMPARTPKGKQSSRTTHVLKLFPLVGANLM